VTHLLTPITKLLCGYKSGLYMRLRHLEIFKAVMETGTTSSAAKLLVVSQPAVSGQLRQFEDQLGIELFQRKGGRLVPTEEARQLYEKACVAFDGFQAVERFSESLRQGTAGRLNFACSPTIAYGPLPKALNEFERAFPKVPISFDTPSNERIASMILSESAEFGLTIAPLNNPFLEAVTLESSPVCYAWPKSWGVNHGDEAMEVQRVPQDRLILYPSSEGIGKIMHAVFHDHNLEPQPWIEVRYVWNALRFVEAGVGATLTDQVSATAANVKEIDFLPIATERRIPWIVTHRRGHVLSITARNFLDKLHIR